jgi:MFS family permease
VAAGLRRIYACAFLADGAFYLVYALIPWKALRLGASPVDLGILPALSAGVYILSALGFGRLADRWHRGRLAHAGIVLEALVILGLLLAPSVRAMMVVMPLLGFGMGMFWPTIQAAIGAAGEDRDLERRIGPFNVAWSLGKMTGFLVGGSLLYRLGETRAFLTALAFPVVLFLLLPWDLPRSRRHPAPADTEARLPALRRRRFRILGWLANFIAFGTGATLNHQYPKLLQSLGLTAQDFGLFLGAVYLTQAGVFVWLTRWRGWIHRWGWLAAAQGLMAGSLLLVPLGDRLALVLPLALGVGLGVGWSYASSIYYSLHGETTQGWHTGIHESLIGTGAFLFPLAGGILVASTGSLAAPYLLCAGASLLFLGWGSLALRRAR